MSDPDRGFVGRHRWAPYALLTLTVLFYSCNHVIGRLVRDDVPPVALVFWRTCVAALLLAPFVYSAVRAQAPLLLRHWKLMVLLGFTNSVTGQALIYVSLHTTTAINVGLINTTQPVLIILMVWLAFSHQPRWRQAAGLVIAVTGVLVIITRGELRVLLGLDFVIGDLWVQAAMVSFAVYVLGVSRVPAGLRPLVLLQAITVTGVITLLPFYALEIGYAGRTMSLTPLTVFAVVFTAVFVSILAIVLFNIGVAHVGPGRSGMIFYLIPVFTSGLAVSLLGEQLRPFHFVGAVLALGGVFLATRAGRLRPGAASRRAV